MATVREHNSARLHRSDTVQVMKPSQQRPPDKDEGVGTDEGFSAFSRQSAPRPGLGWIAAAGVAGLCALGVLFLTGWMPRDQREKSLIIESTKIKSAAPRVITVAPKPS